MGDIKLATSILNDCKLGTNQVDKIYLGNELLWSKETYGTETISFVPTGAATGVATLVVTSNGQQYIKITGGYFYSDSNGTTGQSISKSLNNGINTIYFKCSTTCYINFVSITKINSYDANFLNAPCCTGLSLLSYLDYFNMLGNNTLHNTGADALSDYITFYELHGLNTISNIPVLPLTLLHYKLDGYNTINNISSYGNGIKLFSIGGYNTISSLPSFPSSIQYLEIGGYNTISSIPNIPSGMKEITIAGYNTISSIPNISSTQLERLLIDGYNTISSIPSLPSTIKILGIYGRNTISSMPTLPINISDIRITGYNSISWNISSASTELVILYLQSIYGNYTYNSTPGKSWVGSKIIQIIISPKPNVMTSEMVDSLLIDLNTKTWGTINSGYNTGYISLTGNCGARTSASNAAVASMQSQGVTILTN